MTTFNIANATDWANLSGVGPGDTININATFTSSATKQISNADGVIIDFGANGKINTSASSNVLWLNNCPGAKIYNPRIAKSTTPTQNGTGSGVPLVLEFCPNAQVVGGRITAHSFTFAAALVDSPDSVWDGTIFERASGGWNFSVERSPRCTFRHLYSQHAWFDGFKVLRGSNDCEWYACESWDNGQCVPIGGVDNGDGWDFYSGGAGNRLFACKGGRNGGRTYNLKGRIEENTPCNNIWLINCVSDSPTLNASGAQNHHCMVDTFTGANIPVGIWIHNLVTSGPGHGVLVNNCEIDIDGVTHDGSGGFQAVRINTGQVPTVRDRSFVAHFVDQKKDPKMFENYAKTLPGITHHWDLSGDSDHTDSIGGSGHTLASTEVVTKQAAVTPGAKYKHSVLFGGTGNSKLHSPNHAGIRRGKSVSFGLLLAQLETSQVHGVLTDREDGSNYLSVEIREAGGNAQFHIRCVDSGSSTSRSLDIPGFAIGQPMWVSICIEDDGVINVYINGVLAPGGATGLGPLTTNGLTIGRANSNNNALTGMVDQLVVADALTAAQALELYNRSQVPSLANYGNVKSHPGLDLSTGRTTILPSATS